MPESDSDQPSKRVFLSFPENWDDLTEAEQDEVTGQMADILMAELGQDDGEERTEE